MESKDWSLRHRILGITDAPEDDCLYEDADRRLHWFGGAESFTGLTVGAMQTLMELGFLDPENNTNWSPTAGEFLQFMKRFPQFKAIGYAIDPRRADVRVTIEGMEYDGVPLTPEAVMAFHEFAANADEVDITDDYARCWWD